MSTNLSIFTTFHPAFCLPHTSSPNQLELSLQTITELHRRTTTMHLKRKRSLNTLSSPSPTFTSSTCASSPTSVQSFYAPTKPTPTWFPPTKPFLQPSSIDESDSLRTRKRHHQTRPPIASIHGTSRQPRACRPHTHNRATNVADTCRTIASTMQRLYNAQQHQPVQPVQPAQRQEEMQEARTQEAGTGQTQRSTLHAFWRISAPVPEPAPAAGSLLVTAGRCEDCDGSLVGEDAMEMDGGLGLGDDRGCAECRRMVCDGCAVWGRRGGRRCGGCVAAAAGGF